MNEYNIAQKGEIIVEHFRTYPRTQNQRAEQGYGGAYGSISPPHIARQSVFRFIAAGSFLRFEPGTTAR